MGLYALAALMVYKNTDLPIVIKENRVETAGYRSIIFECPRHFTFASGDWIDIVFARQALKGGNTYSLSSSPTEPDLMITFKGMPGTVAEIKCYLYYDSNHEEKRQN